LPGSPRDATKSTLRALLGNYNIFPGDVLNTRSEDILNALEAAYTDGFEIANMSLGGGAHGIQDLLTMAVNDPDEAGTLVAASAGNSGPGILGGSGERDAGCWRIWQRNGDHGSEQGCCSR